MTKNKIANGLKKGRQEKGYSVKEVSEFLINKGFKAGEKTIYSWESGNSQPTPDVFLTLCIYYEIDDVLENFGDDELNTNNTLDDEKECYNLFGNRLKTIRKQKKYTLERLADEYNERFGGGLNKGTLSKYENNKQQPMITVVNNLSILLGVSVDYLLCKTDNIQNFKEVSDISPLALAVAKKFDKASTKEKNMILIALDLDIINESSQNANMEIAEEIAPQIPIDINKMSTEELEEEYKKRKLKSALKHTTSNVLNTTADTQNTNTGGSASNQ